MIRRFATQHYLVPPAAELMWARSPQDPALVPSPVQITSLLGMGLATYLDPVVAKSYTESKLPYESFPPLADYDRAKNLVAKSFPVGVLMLFPPSLRC
jgi:hypothetical protein